MPIVMTDNERLIFAAQLFRFAMPFLVGLLFFILFKDSNRQLKAFAKYSPLQTKAYLYGIENNDTFLLQYDNTIGRSSKECDINILDRTVSRKHARISYRNGTWEIYDLGSKSGTYVDGKKTDYSELKDGSVIMMGQKKYTFLTQARRKQNSFRRTYNGRR